MYRMASSYALCLSVAFLLLSPPFRIFIMNLSNLRPLGFGETLDRAFTLYRHNFVLLVGTSFLTSMLVFVAVMVLAIILGMTAVVLPGSIALVFMVPVGLGLAAISMIPYGALAQQASQTYMGKQTSLGEGVGAGGRSAMTLVGAAILAALTLGALMLGVMAVAFVLNLVVALTGITALSLVVSFVTILGVAVAMVFVAALFFAVVPAVVVEEKGPVEAIGRSMQLAKGALPRIAGVMVVSMVITYLPIVALAMVTGGFAAISAADPAGMGTGQVVVALILQQLLTLAVSVLALPFLLSVMVVLYYDRRVRTEALDVQIVTERLALAGA